MQGSTPLVISTASPVPLVTQAAGVVQSSISANQQHLPVFCQPAGIHIPHYPPFIPYAPYFSPVYVPPHGIHQLFSSGTFPQQPHSGNLYPNPHGANAKYSNSQNDKGSNASPNHAGVPLNYGPYSIPLANYTPSSASEALNSTSNEEVKGNHTYASEQQVCFFYLHGSPVDYCLIYMVKVIVVATGIIIVKCKYGGHNTLEWFFCLYLSCAVSYDSVLHLVKMSFLLKNVLMLSITSCQTEGSGVCRGQLAFTPTQPALGNYTGVFHSPHAITAATAHPLLLQQSQPITIPIDMVRPTAGVYPLQQQHVQLSWPSNY